MMLVKYGTAVDVYLPAITRGSQDFKLTPTLATNDCLVYKDGGAGATITAIPTNSPAGSAQIKVSLTAPEVSAKIVTVQLVDVTATKEWEDQEIILQTFGHASASIPFDLSQVTPAVNTVSVGATSQTARDLGASVLLSSGTGTGQLDFTSGVVKSNLVQILAAAITGTAASLVASFTKFFNIAVPTGTVNSLPDAVPGANLGLPTTNGTKINQTADLTAGQSIAVSDKTGFSLSTAGILAIWHQATAAIVTASTIGRKLVDWVLGTDNKVLLSTDAQSGVTIPTVTTVTNPPTGMATLANQTTIINALTTIDTVVDTINSDGAKDATVSKPATPQTITPPATMAILANQTAMINALTTIDTIVDSIEAVTNRFDFTEGNAVMAQVVGLETNALTSIDTALSLTHGPGSWDATASGPVTVMAIQVDALTSIDSVLAPRFDNLNYPDGTVYCNSSSAYSGIDYPKGTAIQPVNSIDDACDIATNNKLSKIEIANTGLFDGSKGSRKTFIGRKSAAIYEVDVADGTTCEAAIFENLGIGNAVTGIYERCVFKNCLLQSPILNGALITDSYIVNFANAGNEYLRILNSMLWSDFDFTPGTYFLAEIRNCAGSFTIKNLTGNDQDVRIDGFSGTITIDSSCTKSGKIVISGGSGRIINNGSQAITYNGISIASGTTLNIPAKVNDLSGIDTLITGVTVQAIKNDALTSIDTALAVTHGHGTGAWDAISSGPVTVQAIQAGALTSIDNILAPRFDAIESIDNAIMDKTDLLNFTGEGNVMADLEQIQGSAAKVETLANNINTDNDVITVDVASIETNALQSIDTALSLTHGPGSWDAMASGPVTVMSIQSGALTSIDSLLSLSHGPGSWDAVSIAGPVTVQAFTAGALQSIDDAIVAGGNVPADIQAIDGNESKATILKNALVNIGIDVIQSDMRGMGGSMDKVVAFGNAILGTPDEYTDGRIKAEVSAIQANALTSIDTKLEPRFTNIQNALTTIDAVVDTINSDGAKEATLEGVEIKINGLSTVPTAINNVQVRVDAISVTADAIKAKTSALPADPTSEALATANKNAVLLALGSVDTAIDTIGDKQLPELDGDVGATPTRDEAAMLAYMKTRNKFVQEDPTEDNKYGTVYNDAGVAIIKEKVVDDGTTFTKDKMESA